MVSWDGAPTTLFSFASVRPNTTRYPTILSGPKIPALAERVIAASSPGGIPAVSTSVVVSNFQILVSPVMYAFPEI